MLDARSALAELGHQFGDVVGECNGLREPLLLGTHVAQLDLESGYVGVALGELRGDLRADLAEHLVEHVLSQHVLLEVLDERAFDVVDPLVHGDRTHRFSALMMAPARVHLHAFVAATIDARVGRHDRATTALASRDPGERVPCWRTTDRSAWSP